MNTADLIPSDYLRTVAPEVAEAFKTMRAHISEGPLDYETREYVIIGGFAVAGFEEPFRIHVGRMLDRGVSPEKLRHAVMSLLGASSALFPVVLALKWLDAEIASRAG
ncbi:carboxymuconolactone decarboxylase family protein [Amorphus sp. 3PC139-8]|uniref:carboxymuconolactone decarboxylase family protein n=1 Tax=Amorphus sp. 3PC139-8 TaxID=2735676 RepID=UPI00345C68D5